MSHGPWQRARRHGELAMFDLAVAADMAIDLHVVGRIGEGRADAIAAQEAPIRQSLVFAELARTRIRISSGFGTGRGTRDTGTTSGGS